MEQRAMKDFWGESPHGLHNGIERIHVSACGLHSRSEIAPRNGAYTEIEDKRDRTWIIVIVGGALCFCKTRIANLTKYVVSIALGY